MNLDAVGLWLGRLIMAGFAALVVAELIRYFRTALVEPLAPRAQPHDPLPWKRVLAEVLAAFAASRLLVVLACFACHWIGTGSPADFFMYFEGRLRPWDADHYLGIIERWYVTEGDPRLHIVFLPLYPALGRGLRLLTGLSPFAAALIVSNAALVGCGFVMFRLAEGEGGAALGRRAMLLTLFCPMTYFYSIPYTESLFLLLTLLAALCARRRRFMLAVLPVSLGLLLYLYGNWRLFGNPLQFMVFQRENWSQNLGTLANTFRYCLNNALDYDDHLYQLGVWRPQALLIAAVPALLAWRRKRESPADVAYLLAFFYVSFAPTWLLSGPRYLSAAYALYPLLARIPARKRGFAAMLAAECALLAFMTIVGLWLGKVY